MVFKIENTAVLTSVIDSFCFSLAKQNISSESVFDCKLVVYELVGNVLRHSGGVATLQGGVENGFVKIQIYSSKPFVPPEQSCCSDVLSENGRGLFIVDKICEERIYTPDGGITVTIKVKEKA